jgi:hypothetical protein
VGPPFRFIAFSCRHESYGSENTPMSPYAPAREKINKN